MTEAKHTPGKWRVVSDALNQRDRWIESPQGWRVATLNPHLDASPANARLIAQAPALLNTGWKLAVAALQSDRYAREPDFRDAVDDLLDVCRVARGEPTAEQAIAAKANCR